MSGFIRKVTTASGATAVQIVEKRGGVRQIVEHVGPAHDEVELAVLVHVAHERLHAGQQVLDLGLDAVTDREGPAGVRPAGQAVVNGADQLVRSHDTGANQNNAKDDLVTTWSRDGMSRALSVTENGTTTARVFDGLDVVVDGSVRVTRGPTGTVLFEAFAQVVGNGSKARTVTITRDVLGDLLGTATSIATNGLVTADLALFSDFGDLVTEPDWATSTGFTGHTSAGGVLEFATRSYDPATRIWVQEDTYPGTITRSASTNRYAYVEGAPESFVDALGFAAAQAAILRDLGLSAGEAAYLMALAAQYRAADAVQRVRDERLRVRLAELEAMGSAARIGDSGSQAAVAV